MEQYMERQMEQCMAQQIGQPIGQPIVYPGLSSQKSQILGSPWEIGGFGDIIFGEIITGHWSGS